MSENNVALKMQWLGLALRELAKETLKKGKDGTLVEWPIDTGEKWEALK